MSSEVTLSGSTVMKVMKEVRGLIESPPEGIQVHFSEDNVSQLQFDLSGPVDTPFAGGQFRVRLQLAADHPASAPKGWFLTKIFHPNMNNKTGEICVSTLKKDWKPTLGLRHVMLSIRCLLIEPNPESALNEDAAKLMLDNYADYYARAKMMTKIHAKPAASAVAAAAAAAAKDDEDEAMASPAAAAAAAPAASATAKAASASSPDGAAAAAAAAAAASPSAVGEEENKNTANMPQQASAAAGAAAQVSGVKRPLSVSSAANSSSAAASAAAGAPPAKVSATMSAAAAAEAKAKALKKKSTKRI